MSKSVLIPVVDTGGNAIEAEATLINEGNDVLLRWSYLELTLKVDHFFELIKLLKEQE